MFLPQTYSLPPGKQTLFHTQVELHFLYIYKALARRVKGIAFSPSSTYIALNSVIPWRLGTRPYPIQYPYNHPPSSGPQNACMDPAK